MSFCRFIVLPLLVFVFSSIPAFAQETEEIEASAAEGTVEPYELRLEFLTEPRGVDESKPRFSWKLQSEEAGQFQSAYRIVVYKTKRTSPTLSQPVDTAWDTGKVDLPSQLVEYDGKPLEPKSEYTWMLTVWDKPVEFSDENGSRLLVTARAINTDLPKGANSKRQTRPSTRCSGTSFEARRATI